MPQTNLGLYPSKPSSVYRGGHHSFIQLLFYSTEVWSITITQFFGSFNFFSGLEALKNQTFLSSNIYLKRGLHDPQNTLKIDHF